MLSIYIKNFQSSTVDKKVFNLIKSLGDNYIHRRDLLPFMKILLELHPGLEFLKKHPDFQDKYADTVIMRIFYTCDTNYDNRLSYREFKKSKLLDILNKVCQESDINKIRQFFSYEHFYVLYCKFWELDSNEHDFLIDKEGFSRYESHCLNTRAVDRIFSQVPRKFSSGHFDKMNFEDFLCKYYLFRVYAK